MNTKLTPADRAAVIRDAWTRAYDAAIKAGTPVSQHLSAAMRAAWAEFRQDRAEGRSRVSMTQGYEERYGRMDRALAKQKLSKILAEKAAAEPVVSPRDALVARIARNDRAMDEIQAKIDRDYAVLGSSGIIEYQYQTLDGLHTHGLNLRDDLKELDAAAAAAMVPQPAQQQQANAGLPGAGACEVCGRPLTDPVSVEAGIGPVCRSHGHARRQLSIFDNRSDYRVELAGDVICVTDLNLGGRSVTNDAEGVIRDLAEAGYDLARMPVIYRDSQRNWDEMVVLNGRFAGFRAIDEARKLALRAIAKGLDVPPVEMVAQPVQQQQACAAPAPWSSVKPTRYTETHVHLHGAEPAPILDRRVDGRVIVAAPGKRNRWIVVDQAAPSKALVKAAGKKARAADERLVVATDDLPEVLATVEAFLTGGGEQEAAAKEARAKAAAEARAAAKAEAEKAERLAQAAAARAEADAAARERQAAYAAAKPARDAACLAVAGGAVAYDPWHGAFRILTAYDARIVAALRGVPGAKWDAATRRWTVPSTSHEALARVAADINAWADEAAAAEAKATRAADEARRERARALNARRYLVPAADAPRPGDVIRFGHRTIVVEELGRVFRGPEDDGLIDPWMEGEPVQYVYHRPATAEEAANARKVK